MDKKSRGKNAYIIVFLIMSMLFFAIESVSIERAGGKTLNSSKITNKGTWNTTFGGLDHDFGSVVIQTIDGGYAVAGSTNSYGTGSQDMWLVNTDSNGQLEWNQSYGGEQIDYCTDLLQTTDGGFLLVGYTESSLMSLYNTAIWLLKTDKDGKVQWNQFYGENEWEFFPPLLDLSLIETSTGEIAIGGTVILSKFQGIVITMLLIKTDSNGTVTWTHTYEENGQNGARDLLQTPDGGFVLVGWTTCYGDGSEDMWLVKTDENGTVQWNQTYGGEDKEIAYDCIQTNDGGFALVGTTNSNGNEDFWLVKTDHTGSYQWSQAYGSSRDDYSRALLQTMEGEYILAGRTYARTNSDIYLIKTNPKGDLQGSRIYGGDENEYLGGILQPSNNTLLVVGSTESSGTGKSDIWMVNTGTINFSNIESTTVTITSTDQTSITLPDDVFGFTFLILITGLLFLSRMKVRK